MTDLFQMLAGVLRDEMRAVIAPPPIFACVVTLMTSLAVLAAWRLRHHPDPLRRIVIRFVAGWAVLELPTRMEDPAVLGRVVFALLLSALFLSMAVPPRAPQRAARFWQRTKEQGGQHELG